MKSTINAHLCSVCLKWCFYKIININAHQKGHNCDFFRLDNSSVSMMPSQRQSCYRAWKSPNAIWHIIYHARGGDELYLFVPRMPPFVANLCGLLSDAGVIVAVMMRRRLGRPSFTRRPASDAIAVRLAPARTRSRSGSAGLALGGRLAVAGRSVCRKYRKASIRRLQQQEYDKLCRIVPALATRRHRRRIAKVTVTSPLVSPDSPASLISD